MLITFSRPSGAAFESNISQAFRKKWTLMPCLRGLGPWDARLPRMLVTLLGFSS